MAFTRIQKDLCDKSGAMSPDSALHVTAPFKVNPPYVGHCDGYQEEQAEEANIRCETRLGARPAGFSFSIKKVK